MIDISVYLEAAAAGVPILFIVWGLVQVVKKLTNPDGTPSVKGNALLLTSLAIGLVIGVGYWYFATEPPATPSPRAYYAYWFAGVIYGLGLGLLASLFWDALKALVDAAIDRLAKRQLAASYAPTRPPTPPEAFTSSQ